MKAIIIILSNYSSFSCYTSISRKILNSLIGLVLYLQTKSLLVNSYWTDLCNKHLESDCYSVSATVHVFYIIGYNLHVHSWLWSY